MEGFEHLVKLALEGENLLVTGPVKFPVKVQTGRKDREERQTHGYEVDLIGVNRHKIVLCSVKSYFGSKGVMARAFLDPANSDCELSLKAIKTFRIFHDDEVRSEILKIACGKYGYSLNQVEMRLYAGKFYRNDEEEVRSRLEQQGRRIGINISVCGLDQILPDVFEILKRTTYIDDPIIQTLKALVEAKRRQSKLKGRESWTAAVSELSEFFECKDTKNKLA